MSVDTSKVCKKGNRSASIRARKYGQEIKELIPYFRKEILQVIKKHETQKMKKHDN
jgi:septum formation topological specificity factor MinE